MLSIRLGDLAKKLNAKLYGDYNISIAGIASLKSARKSQITFMSNPSYDKYLEECQASAVVIDTSYFPFFRFKMAALVVKDPYLAYSKIAQFFDSTPLPAAHIDPRTVIHTNAKIGKGVAVGANTVIESGVRLCDNVIVGPGCFIGQNTHIGVGTRLWANVSIYHEITIGKKCLIQSGAIIGSDGFGYANDHGNWVKIPQLGKVVIGDYVEIGAGTTIDRGALDDTLIGKGVIIDNQCQIAHGVRIGDNTAIAGGVILAGSLKIGRHCMIGGASVINGHMEICDGVTVTGMGMVMRPIKEPGKYSSGIPLQKNKVWRKTAALVMNIDDMSKRLKAIERKINQD